LLNCSLYPTVQIFPTALFEAAGPTTARRVSIARASRRPAHARATASRATSTRDDDRRSLDRSTAPRASERARRTIDSIFKKRHRYPT
jgi:hypothetical protein